MSYDRCYRRLSGVAPALFQVAGTLLWVGARIPGLHCYPELKALGHEITVLEIWLPNIELLNQYQPDIDHVVCGDVRKLAVVELPHKCYDYVFWYQGPEHVLEEELPTTLTGLESICTTLILVGMSWGLYEQGPIFGNPYEVHLSHLDEPLFHRLGYSTKTFGQKDVRGSELLAWKDMIG